MARGLVYTAIFGDYDVPKPVRVQEEGVDYVMVTDGKGAEGWDVQHTGIKGTPREVARRVKVAMPILMGEEGRCYDWFLWLDGTMEITGPVKVFAEKALEKHDFAAWKHPWWQCSYIEIDKCIALKKDSRKALERSRKHLEREKLPKYLGQLASWVLFRKNTPLVHRHAADWWHAMETYTMRDQVFFMLTLWKLDVGIQWLSGTIDDVKWLKFHRGHKKRR